MKSLDVNNITQKTINKLVNDGGFGENLRPEQVRNVSIGAGAICTWVRGIYEMWQYCKPKILLEQKKNQILTEIESEQSALVKSGKKQNKISASKNEVLDGGFNPYRFSTKPQNDQDEQNRKFEIHNLQEQALQNLA